MILRNGPDCLATRLENRYVISYHGRIRSVNRALRLWPASRQLAGPALKQRGRCNYSKAHDDEAGMHEQRLSPGVAYTKKDLTDLTWSPATVIKNEAVSLDGSIRLLHLSVSEQVDVLYGRRAKGVQEARRWVENYSLPGQCVGVRLPGASTTPQQPHQLYVISSSPYQARSDSAYIGGSIIEVVVSRCGSAAESQLLALAPGTELEERRSLLLVGVGTRGIAALRAALNWQPVLAHAAAHRVSAIYVARCASQAAFVPEWDSWREAGIQFTTLYTDPSAPMIEPSAPNGTAPHATHASTSAWPSAHEADDVLAMLEDGLFYGEGGLDRLAGGKASEACVLLAGLPQSIAPRIAKELHRQKIEHERMLFCEYF